MTAPAKATVEVNFKATGTEQVRNGLKLVGREGEANLQKVGMASRQIAGGIEAVARQGKVTGEAMKQILASGAEMAFTFGAAGPIVGAIAITGMAIYEHIVGRTKEARDEINNFRKDLEGFSRSSDLVGSARRQQYLYSGDPNAIRQEGESERDFAARSGGLEGLRKYRDKIATDYAANRSVFKGGWQKAGELAATEQMLQRMEAMSKEASNVTARLSGNEGSRAKTEVQLAQEKRDKDYEMSVLDASSRGLDIRGDLSGLERQEMMKGLGVQQIGGFLSSQTMARAGSVGDMSGARAIAGEIKPMMRNVQNELAMAFQEQVQVPLEDTIRSGIGSTIGSAISEGIAAGFESGSIGGAFKAAGKAILAGLGSIISQMGQVWVEYGISMTALGQALWNPITSGPAAIAIGASLIALGAAVGGIAHGRAGGAGGGSMSSVSAPPQIIDRGLINPNGALMASASGLSPMQPMNVTIIGPNDPSAQRAVAELMKNANNRGSL